MALSPCSFIKPPKNAQGFTLTELLIALVLLGVIAAFSIPKILLAVGEQKKTAILKESVMALEDAFYTLKLNGGVEFYTSPAASPNNDLHAFLDTEVNHAGTDRSSKGPPGYTGGCNNSDVANGYFLMYSGALISGLAGADSGSSVSPRYHLICIDIDGVSGQNTLGSDVFYGNFRYTPNGKAFYWSSSVGNNPPGAANNTFCADDTDASCGTTVAVDATTEDVGHLLTSGD